MNWYLIAASVLGVLFALHHRREVRDGIQYDRLVNVITEDAFFGGLYTGIALMCIMGALLLWLNIL